MVSTNDFYNNDKLASTYNDWQIKTANYTCVADDQIIVNSTGILTPDRAASLRLGIPL